MNENVSNVNKVNEDIGNMPSPTALVLPTVAEARDEIVMVTPSQLANPTQANMYCSLQDDGTPKSKANIYNAINSPDMKLSEAIGEVIEMVHIVAHEVVLVDEETGETIKALRSIICDKNGKTYEAVSGGVANSLMRIIQIFGQPETWKEPIKVKARQKATRNGNNKVTTLEVIG